MGNRPFTLPPRPNVAAAETATSTARPPFTALRQCLELQGESPRLSRFARLFGADPLQRAAGRSYRGAIAELSVAGALSSLGEDWTVLHSVPIGPDVASIEHLVIGPPGVLIISTKSHAGQRVWAGELMFIADDVRHPYLPLAEQQNGAVAERLASEDRALVPVTSCLVVAGPCELTVKRHARHIEIVPSRDFGRWLLDLPRLVSPQLVSALAASASGWSMPDDQVDDTELHLVAFDRLRRSIRRSLLLRAGWVGVALALSYGALYSGALALLGVAH